VTDDADGRPMVPDRPVSPEEMGKPTWAGLVQWDVFGALMRYRVMAFIVGTALLCLTVIVICQYGLGLHAQMKTPELIVAPLHGYLYLAYLVTAADLARRARWHLGRIILVVCSGFVPFLAFIIENRVYKQMQGEYAEFLASGAQGEFQGRPTAPLSD
jgi:integral membrane protein